ncbi:MAG: hypothetical protein GTO03_16410 [Planctomycetales bacterium]|nr:hypothetical protein [Planctomycetales bacterium]
MDVGTLSFALFLIAISVGLVGGHVYTWRGERSPGQASADPRGNYARRKFRRRMQASLMIGITGIAIAASASLPNDPVVHTIYWAGVILWVVWIALLALADVVATQQHFRRLRDAHLIEEAHLRNQLKQHRQRGNGRAAPAGDQTTRPG